jgi:hypothetical protein
MMLSKYVLLGFVLVVSTLVWADDEDSFTSYDSIISELRQAARKPERQETQNLFPKLTFHGGLSLAASVINISSSTFRNPTGGVLKGFEAHVGVDLLTSTARGELAFRNLGPDPTGRDLEIALRELEARIVFLPNLQDRLNLRMGGGLSARTLKIRSRLLEASEVQGTPFYSLFVGLERKLADSVSVGPDLAYRSSLDASSIDKSSWDACFRLNATF